MACIRRRRGRYVVDYRDARGIRRWVSCRTREEATAVLGDKIREARQHTAPFVDPAITVRAYAERWFRLIAATVKQRTCESYATVYRLHLDPTLGPLRVRNLTRGRIRELLVDKLKAGKPARRPGMPDR